MKFALIVFLLISACNDNTESLKTPSKGSVMANKLLSHGYRKYTYKQFSSASKAYLEAFFLYKDLGIKPEPKLYLGFSALVIQGLNNISTYPVTKRIYIVGNEKEKIVNNKIDLFKISLSYILAAKELTKSKGTIEVLNRLILCHESHVSRESESCDLIDVNTFSFKLD